MARRINLPQPKELVVVPEVKITVNALDIEVSDDGEKVVAKILYPDRQGFNTMVLWSSETNPTYTTIGQWTDTDVDNRLNSIL